MKTELKRQIPQNFGEEHLRAFDNVRAQLYLIDADIDKTIEAIKAETRENDGSSGDTAPERSEGLLKALEELRERTRRIDAEIDQLDCAYDPVGIQDE